MANQKTIKKEENTITYNQGVSKWTETNVSYSGADILVTAECNVYNNRIRVAMGSIQTVSYSIYDEMKPIHALGNVNAKDYVHTHRTIAGSMVFAVFNQHWAKDILIQYAKAAGYKQETKLLMDEIPPLDLTFSMGNEMGCQSRLAIYGVRFFNESMVMSINDIYTENTFEFTAMNVDYLENLNSIDLSTSKDNNQKSSTKTPIPTKVPNDGGAKIEDESIEQKKEEESNNTKEKQYIHYDSFEDFNDAIWETMQRKCAESKQELINGVINEKEYKRRLKQYQKDFIRQRNEGLEYYTNK